MGICLMGRIPVFLRLKSVFDIMRKIDILTKDKLYAQMISAELQNAGYSPYIGRTKNADLIICDLDSSEIYGTDIPVITYSENKEADLTSPFSIAVLLEKIASAFGTLAVSADDTLILYSGKCEYNSKVTELTPLEYKLLCYLNNQKGKVVSSKDIARDVFDTDDLNNVRVYICYLRKKLDKCFSHKIIYSVHNKGYLIK